MIDKTFNERGLDLSKQEFGRGIDILKVAVAALSYAAFKPEAEVLEQMVKFLEQTD